MLLLNRLLPAVKEAAGRVYTLPASFAAKQGIEKWTVWLAIMTFFMNCIMIPAVWLWSLEWIDLLLPIWFTIGIVQSKNLLRLGVRNINVLERLVPEITILYQGKNGSWFVGEFFNGQIGIGSMGDGYPTVLSENIPAWYNKSFRAWWIKNVLRKPPRIAPEDTHVWLTPYAAYMAFIDGLIHPGMVDSYRVRGRFKLSAHKYELTDEVIAEITLDAIKKARNE